MSNVQYEQTEHEQQTEVQTKTEQEPSLKGTLVSVMLLGTFIVVGKITPLFGFMTVGTILLWFVASIGVAATVLLQFLPWSLGLVDSINVLLSRTLFWYFGHPLVYFWLLPAYMAWYVSIPKIIGGKLFSDSLARLAFVLFLLLSIPVGFHHQLMEAGIPEFWKYLQVVLTSLFLHRKQKQNFQSVKWQKTHRKHQKSWKTGNCGLALPQP
jgi:cbb3-type cytochrome oxidase subunit 1